MALPILTWISDIFKNIVTEKVSGQIIKKTREKFSKTLFLEKAWGFLAESTHVFLSLKTENENRIVGGYGDILALADITLLANNLFQMGNINVHTNPEAFRHVCRENIIILGGGKYNPIFLKIIDEMNVPLHFFDTPEQSFYEIRDKEKTRRLKPAYDQKGNVTEDVGLLVRAKNCFNEDKKIIIAAGCHTYGTSAAIRYFTNSANAKKIMKKELNNDFELIVRCEVREHSIIDISEEYFIPLERPERRKK